VAVDWARVRANLERRIEALSDEIAAMDATKAGGLPDYKGAGGIGHVAYRESLEKEMERLIGRLAMLPAAGPGTGGTVERIVNI
jgi:hypothetical protein